MAKKLVLVHDPVRGGASIDYIKEEECPDDLQIIFHKRAIITWHRIKEVSTPSPSHDRPPRISWAQRVNQQQCASLLAHSFSKSA